VHLTKGRGRLTKIPKQKMSLLPKKQKQQMERKDVNEDVNIGRKEPAKWEILVTLLILVLPV